MAVNEMSFTQLATVLSSIVGQATGRTGLTATDTSSFVAVAKLGLETGYDPLLSAISQVLSKTIFRNDPYSRKFKGLKADARRYGNHVRKLNPMDSGFETDARNTLTDGYSVDQQVVKKPKVLQTNLYGNSVYQKHITIFKDQLDVAFSSSDEFGQFLSMVMQNASDEIEKAHEETARAILTNFIMGKNYLADQSEASDHGEIHRIYLLDEYNAATGETVSKTDYMAQENFAPFMRWLSGYVKTLVGRMSERTTIYHQNFEDSDSNVLWIPRSTPERKLKCYLNSDVMNASEASVMSTTFNDDRMKMIDYEAVNFWQAFGSPMSLSLTAGVTDYSGDADDTGAETLDQVFGVIFDEEAVGYTTINAWSAPAPFNAAGGYTNMYWHFTDRHWNDFTENGVILLLDNAPSPTPGGDGGDDGDG